MAKFALPLGLLGAGPSSVYMSHLASLLVPDENDFTPFNTIASFTLATMATAEDRKIVAFTDGEYTIAGGIITCQFLPDAILELKQKFKQENWPVPRTIIYGQVDREDGTVTFRSGDPVGNLVGDTLSVQFRDENDFYLNAYTCLSHLRTFDFFPGDITWDFPFSRNNTREWQEIACTTCLLTDPYWELKGGSLQTVIFNPTGNLPTDICSFLSSDILDIIIHNTGPAQTLRIEIADGENSMYQPGRQQKIINGVDEFLFLPNDHLLPFHKPYKKTSPQNGKRVPGLPLHYSIEVFVDEISLSRASIRQDNVDLIRQEYTFHSKPFQDSAVNNSIQRQFLEVPKRESVKLLQFRSGYFAQDAFKDLSNYNDYIIDVDKVINLAELMRRKFMDEILELYDTAIVPPPDVLGSYDLKITSAWRNPERNEDVGGAHNSDHQFGRALDMKSAHCVTSGTMAAPVANPKNVPLHYAMFQAGKKYMLDMIARHGIAKCRSLQVMMERNYHPILSFIINAAGEVVIKKDSQYHTYVPAAPVRTTELELIPPAALYASHVHVSWDTPDGSVLSFPDIPSYGDINIVPLLPFKNVIVVATEAGDVPASSQLPLLHIAETLKGYLESLPDPVETLIVEVNDPVEFLEAIGALNPFCRIKYFFSMGHAYQYGIILKHLVNPVADPGLEERIRQVYGQKLVFGRDDFSEFSLNQLRVSNLRYLPEGMVKTLRSIFRKAEGVFVLGCNAANDQDATENTFCEEFASVIGQSVYGAGYYSKVFEYDDDGWQPVSINRADPIDPMKNYVLAPNEKGGGQFFKYVYDHGLPENLHPSSAIDILEFYRESLEICLPDPNFDHSKHQSVFEPIDLELGE